jgi:CRP/FNR family cyclic AMP-dependent transcriptional regulator
VSAGERRSGIAACPLFEGLEPDALDHLADASSLVQARRGETVIREGTEGDSLYVIVEGRVRTEKRTPSGDPWTVRFYGKGGVFGEVSLLDRVRRSATVVAEADGTLLVIGRDRFVAFGDRHPAAGLAVTRRLAERLASRLRRATEDVVTLFSALVHEVERKL